MGTQSLSPFLGRSAGVPRRQPPARRCAQGQQRQCGGFRRGGAQPAQRAAHAGIPAGPVVQHQGRHVVVVDLPVAPRRLSPAPPERRHLPGGMATRLRLCRSPCIVGWPTSTVTQQRVAVPRRQSVLRLGLCAAGLPTRRGPSRVSCAVGRETHHARRWSLCAILKCSKLIRELL